LGVAHLLEGSVRRENDKVRITAQLIDAGMMGIFGPSITTAIWRTFSQSKARWPRTSLRN